MSGDHELGKEALQLTELHGRFGHKYVKTFCMCTFTYYYFNEVSMTVHSAL